MKAIINGNIVTMAGQNYPKGQILIEGTKIKEVGQEIVIPSDCEIIDAKGKLVLPGFIDAHSHIGMWEEAIDFQGADGNEMTDPITPELRALDGVFPMEPPFRDAVKGGVTAVATGPGSTNVIGGQFLAMKTYGICADKMIIKEPLAMKVALGENPKTYYKQKNMAPITRMGIAAMLRNTLKETIDYMKHKEAASGDVLKMPSFNAKYEAMIPVINKELHVKVHAHRADDILTAIRIAKEFDIIITLDHCTEGHLIVDEIKASGFSAIVGPSFGFKTKPELKNKCFATAGILANAGIPVAIMTDHPVHNQHDLPLFAAMAVKEGMTREDALKAITITAAQIIGIDSRVGSIEPGKDADIVIWENDPFSVDYKAYSTIVSGKVVYELDKKVI